MKWSTLGKGNEARIDIEIHNPNATWGIARGTYELVLLDKSGGVVGVTGTGGLPGASCCTLYQVPPDGTYWISDVAEGADALATASIEIRVKTGWVDWATTSAAPAVTLTGTKLRISAFAGAQKDIAITGRVTVAGAGVFNVQVMAVIEGTGGFAATYAIMDCVQAGTPTAFEIDDLLVPPSKPTLARVVAVTTTIPGVGVIDQPPGC